MLHLQGPVDSLPLVCWQFAIIQVANKKVVDPVSNEFIIE